MRDIRLIALDLDGTLLNSEKELSPGNYAALAAAAAAGVHIVPCTGRFYGAMPEVIRTLPFVRYVITINGAQVWDAETETALYTAEIPAAEAVEIMAALDSLPLIYDCFLDNAAWMTAALKEKAADYAPDRHYLKMLRELRRPVPELKDFVRAHGGGVQKIQFFTWDFPLRARLLKELPERFPALVASASAPNNVELNNARATKGEAMLFLARRLGLEPARTMAFGDGLNDVPMLRAAGLGVAMGNAAPEIQSQADWVTGTNDDDGVAAAIERFVL